MKRFFEQLRPFYWLLCCAALPVISADEPQRSSTSDMNKRNNVVSIYLPIHATSLELKGIENLDPITVGLDELLEVSTAYFTIGVKWQNNDWFHSFELWEGKYEPFGELGQQEDLGDIPLTDDGKIVLIDATGNVYLHLRQRIMEYRGGYRFGGLDNLDYYVIGGIKEYDITTDIEANVVAESVAIGGSVCLPINCIELGNRGLDIKRTINTRWAEAVIGLQADYMPFKNSKFTFLFNKGLIGGSSHQIDVKGGYIFDSGLFTELGYRWHQFEEDGLEFTQNGAFLSLGYSF
ncbi:hypothetical protein [Thalassotalea agarivorans]|uniref:Uncharacterized protein n=1 Tax=Thalassotalea agarivorans TaxID=349064 RepID=A0A1I0CJU0_THASX|nr:hypothetical protein [Thalassotalea agarivorans]SET19882.1 hypothetical protein SAMN05660429_01224 [Thalassotalea agarivorans]